MPLVNPHVNPVSRWIQCHVAVIKSQDKSYVCVCTSFHCCLKKESLDRLWTYEHYSHMQDLRFSWWCWRRFKPSRMFIPCWFVNSYHCDSPERWYLHCVPLILSLSTAAVIEVYSIGGLHELELRVCFSPRVQPIRLCRRVSKCSRPVSEQVLHLLKISLDVQQWNISSFTSNSIFHFWIRKCIVHRNCHSVPSHK